MSKFNVGDKVIWPACPRFGEGVVTAETRRETLSGRVAVRFKKYRDYVDHTRRDYHDVLESELRLAEEDLTDVNPSHYDFPEGVQVIDITKHLDFLRGNAVKYLCRAGRKGDAMTDLKKALRYVEWAIEKEESTV